MSSARSSYDDITPYVTMDGTLVRELMHPAVHGNRRQSLAEATLAPGQMSERHRHRTSEELYYVTAGEGYVTLGEKSLVLRAGDTVCIAPGTPHSVRNSGTEPLRILCCCSPAYSHDDTELL